MIVLKTAHFDSITGNWRVTDRAHYVAEETKCRGWYEYTVPAHWARFDGGKWVHGSLDDMLWSYVWPELKLDYVKWWIESYPAIQRTGIKQLVAV